MRILVVDDNKPAVKLTEFLLKEEGYEVVTTDNGRDALRIVESEPIDLIVLDVMMPNMDGFEVCRRVRTISPDTAIIFVSAKGEIEDKVHGLKVGADDYLTKPFEPSELVARIEAVLRRSVRAREFDTNNIVEVGGLRLDPMSNLLRLPDGKRVDLTPTESRLLHALMRNAGRTLTHDMLLEAGWGSNYIGSNNQVAVYIRRLRAKMGDDPDKPRYIQTVRGIGYRFDA